ncbi:MAG: transglutaminase domain-containing protein [Promethearchaeota archaeon]
MAKGKVLAVTVIILLIGSFAYLYISMPQLFSPPVSQLEYNTIQQQDDVIIISGQQDLDFDSWGDLGDFFENVSYEFYDQIPSTDIPFIPPIDPNLTDQYGDLLNITFFNVTPGTPPKYWKMTSYDYYNSSQWEKTNASQTDLSLIGLGEVPPNATIFTIYMNISHGLSGNLLLPIISPNPMLIDGSFSLIPSDNYLNHTTATDTYGSALLTISFTNQGNSTITYDVSYQPLNLTDIEASAGSPSDTPIWIQTLFLQVPGGRAAYLSANPFVAGTVGLFESYAQTHNVFETATQILGYLTSNYVFDPFAPRPPSGRDQVDWFLENGNGTSQDFSTAYTVILRCLNISSRFVYGFLPGERVGSFRIIRGWNIHFWSEVWVPNSTSGGNWVQFDPTPLPSDISDIVGDDDGVTSVRYNLFLFANDTILVSPVSIGRGEFVEFEARMMNNSQPMGNVDIVFIDQTDDRFLGQLQTDPDGWANLTIECNSTSIVGPHRILAYALNYPTVQNITVFLLEGSTSLTMSANPSSPPNATRGIETVQISGTLSDSVNGSGISNQYVDVFWDGINVTRGMTDQSGQYSITYLVPLGNPNTNTSVYVSFNGDFLIQVGGIPLFYSVSGASSTSSTENVTIVASSWVTTEVNATAVVPGDNILIYGYLGLDNMTPLAGEIVEIWWRNDSDYLINNATTDGSGYYEYVYAVPLGSSGEVKIYSYYRSPDPYILDSYTDPTIYIGQTKIVNLVVDLTNASRGDIITVTGLLLDSDDQPIINQQVTIQFFIMPGEVLSGTTSATTNSIGQFSATYQIPSAFSVGEYKINGTTTIPGLIVSEEDFMNVNSATSITFDVTPYFAMPGENISISGILTDDQGNPISGRNVTIYFDGAPIGTLTTSLTGQFVISNYQVSYGLSSGTVLITASHNSGDYYYGSTRNESLMIFTRSTVAISVSPRNVYPGDIVTISGNATDNLGRLIQNRTVAIYWNESHITTLILTDGSFEFNYNVPTNATEGFVSVYGLLIPEAQSQYIADTITIMERVGMQITLDLIIYAVAIIAIGVVAYFGWRLYKKRVTAPIRVKPIVTVGGRLAKLRALINAGKKREALINAFDVLVRVVSTNYAVSRSTSQTSREFAENVISQTSISSQAFYEFTKIYEKARFSKHTLSDPEFKTGIQLFATLYNQITGGQLQIAGA